MTRLNFPDPADSPYTENGITYVWNDNGGDPAIGFWEATGDAINLQTVTDAGNTATRGATFGGALQTGGDARAGTAMGIHLDPTGTVSATTNTGTGALWEGYTTGGAVTSSISANGTAVFNAGAAGTTPSIGVDIKNRSTSGNDPTLGLQNTANGRLFAGKNPAGNDVVVFQHDGQCQFGLNNLIQFNNDGRIVLRGTSPVGIQFGTTNASAPITSQTLDDYEEGTWTPQDQDDNAFSDCTGFYRKVGSIVHCMVSFQGTTLNGVSAIKNFPFTGKTTQYNGHVSLGYVTYIKGGNPASFTEKTYPLFQNSLGGYTSARFASPISSTEFAIGDYQAWTFTYIAS